MSLSNQYFGLVSSTGWVPDFGTVGSDSISGRTNARGVEISEKNVLSSD